MLVRLALENEAEALVSMAAAAVAETKPAHTFSADRVREVYAAYLATANPTFFFVEQRRVPIGFLQAEIGAYDFTDGIFTVQKTIYVQPDKRGTRAAVLLMRHLTDWSRRLGAREIFGGVDNGYQIGRTSRFLERLGFVRDGWSMHMSLNDG